MEWTSSLPLTPQSEMNDFEAKDSHLYAQLNKGRKKRQKFTGIYYWPVRDTLTAALIVPMLCSITTQSWKLIPLCLSIRHKIRHHTASLPQSSNPKITAPAFNRKLLLTWTNVILSSITVSPSTPTTLKKKKKEISYSLPIETWPEENSSILKWWCNCFLMWKFTLRPLFRTHTNDGKWDCNIL